MLNKLLSKEYSIAIVGLGYVGLPLAVGLSRYFKVIGFDINKSRIEELVQGYDRTNEVEKNKLSQCDIAFTSMPSDLKKASVIITAVPTPIDAHLRPDLEPVESASRLIGSNMSKGAVVVYESTVYPGVTEDICVPILERESGLLYGRDFTVGYSPERINPGDKVHTVENIVKVVSASDDATLELLSHIYGKLVKAGIHKASSIKVAEAAKVIENTQRDINIALMNELALIFERLDIDTHEVLEAAGTKWNFMPFRPGLVGGHCIGVDPYYLTFKAQEVGYLPEVILAGRRINDNMGKFVAQTCIREIIKKDCLVKGARVGILGLTFKENVPDLRNTKVMDIIKELESYETCPIVHDPLARPEDAEKEYGLSLQSLDEFKELDALILAVAHSDYQDLTQEKLLSFFKNPKKAVLLDLKGFFETKKVRSAGISLWRL